MKRLISSIAVLAAVFILTTTLQAADVAWDGGGVDDNLRSDLNWVGDSAPDTNDVLIFKGTVRTTPNNDFTADTQLNGLIFSNTVAGQSFTLGGNAVDLGGDITGVAAAGTIDDTISLPIEVVGAERSINLNSNHNLTISGAISGSQVLVKDGEGTLNLTSENTHSGGFQLKDGTVKITDSAALGTATVSLQQPGGPTLDLGVNALSIANSFFIPNWGGTAKTVRLDLGGANTGTLAGNVDIRFGTANGFVADVGTDDTLTYSGIIATGAGGGAGITKEGNGTLVLSGNNTYLGNTTIKEGTLETTHANGLGSSVNGTIVEDGATLKLNHSGNCLDPITISGSGVDGNGAIITVGAGKGLGGTMTLATNAVIGGDQRMDIWAQITDNDNGYTLTKKGNFSFVPSGTANFSHLVVDQGEWLMTGNNAIPGSLGDVTVNTGGKLTLWGALNVTKEPNIIINDSIYATYKNTPNSSAITGTMTLNGAVSFESWSTDHTIYSDISGSGDLTVKSVINNQDSARYTFAGESTYSGSTTVGTGASGVGKMTLRAGSFTGLSSNSAHTVTANSTLALNGYDNTVGSLAGAGVVENGGYLAVLEDDFSSGSVPVTFRAYENQFDQGWWKCWGPDSETMSQWVISGGVVENSSTNAASGYPLSKPAEAALFQTFSNIACSNTHLNLSFDYSVPPGDKLYAHLWGYTGTITPIGFVCNIEGSANGGISNDEGFDGSTLDAFNLKDGATTGFGGATSAISGELTGSGSFSNSISISDLGIEGVQNVGDFDYFLIAFAKDEDGTIGTTSVDNVSLIIADPTVLTAGVDGSSTMFSGLIQDGADGNALGFTKSGSGTQTLSTPNTYTGPTTVLGGTLLLGGDNTLSDSTELVMDGGTLDADATTDTIGSLNLKSDSTLLLGTAEITFGDSTALTWSGTLTLSGTLGPTSLRFVPNISAEQRAHISYNGNPVSITEDGYIIPLSGTVILVR
ncbi:MAG: autotransporter-associated beta strand repeat-containing protein [Kiritimatiellae bacterium]|jgi:fibronectin-binding autotransporter adhesin|nr:autotransporter-associated beta strand repeat-containing protein [Kiritimatiellia bacterium]